MGVNIKTWLERMAERFGDRIMAELGDGVDAFGGEYKSTEIIDLRAALADLNRKNLELTRVNHEQRLQVERLDVALARVLSASQGCGPARKETPYGTAICGKCVEADDEREKFEAAARGIGWPSGAFEIDAAGVYIARYTEWSWKLWQIRASKPRQRADPGVTWQLVPTVPTEEMWLAGTSAMNLDRSWDAMLAAAPTAPAEGGL